MLPRYSVKRPYTVLVGVVLILILGYVSFTSMQTDLLPDMTLPYAIVYTTYPGASPEEVETIVTRPVEQSMATISNIENVSSVSSENISMVILEFSQSANMDAVTIEMRENLDQIEGYWDDSIGSPIIMKLNPDMLPVMVAAMEDGDMSQSDLTDLVNNTILPELESIEGVASVSTTGTIEEQVQVTLREDKIKAVNRRVTQALDDKFAEAESELAEAQEKLDEGKEELENGQTQLADQTSSAESQINSGTSQMITGQVQIDQKLAEVQSGLTKLDDSEAELLAKEQELLAGEAALQKLPEQKAALEAQKAQLDAGISQLEAAPQQLAELDTAIAGVEAAIKELEKQIADLQGAAVPGETETDAAQGDTGDETQADAAQPGSGNESQADSQSLEPETSGIRKNETEKTQAAEISEAEDVAAASVPETEQYLETAVGLADGMTTAVSSDDSMTADAFAADDGELILDGENTGESGASQNQTDVSIPQINPGLSQEEIDRLTQDAQQEAVIAALQTKILELQSQQLTLENTKNQALAALATLGVNINGTAQERDESIDTVKSELVARRIQIVDGIAQMQTTIDGMPEQMEQIIAGKAQIESGKAQLAEGRAQLLAAQKQLETAKAQIASGQTSVSAAVGELNKAKISATIEMAAGKAELSAGQKELDAALEQIKQQKEAAYDQADVTEIITADMVKGILAAQNFSMPAGYVTEDGVDFLVRVGNKLDGTESIEDLLLLDLHMDGLEPIRLSDVADVVILDNSDEVYAKINGHSGILFTMQKQSGYSTGEVSKRIKEKFAELEESDENINIIEMMDQGIYIDLVVDSVLENMLSGAGLAILVLLLFLKSFRPTLVIACSIPISIMTAIVAMYFSNITLNIISLSGLALGIGMLVDNSIVVIENIYRLRAEGYSVKKAAVEGANQVAGAIAASTLTTVCVFLPIVFTEGITRQLFVDMGLTIAYSLGASLIVALTLVPAMGAGLLKNVKEKRSPFFSVIQNGYAKLLGWSLKVKFLVLLLAVGLLAFSAKLALSKGTAFMPEMESTQVSVTLNMPEGSLLSETAKMADEVMERIRTIPDVTDVGGMSGGSGMMSMMGGSQSADAESVSIYVLLSEDKTISNDELKAQIMEKTSDLDCELAVETSTMDMSALGGSGISINIKGRELDELKRIAGEVAEIVESVEGTADVSDGIAEKTLELRLVVDKDKAMGYQLTTAQVYQFLQAKLADASSATTLSTLSKDYPVLVVSDTDETLTRDKIKDLTITGKDEEGKDVEVPVADLVEFVDTEGFSSINREAQTRYVTVSAQIADGYNIGLVSEDLNAALENYELPKGYSLEMAGEDQTINEAMTEVVKMLLLALAFMYLIMVAQFQSLLSPFIIMFTIPLAFTGGLLALYLTDNPVSVIAMIGFVMLSGIIVNNGIVLVDCINQLRRGGMEKRAAIIEAGRTRLRPIIMTALTTILGLLTMALGNGMGADMVQPMAIVTVGGLTYGTLLTLFVVPCIYDIFNRKKDMTEEEI
ncbi:MAG: efflux RND transporter permease subunit [Marvinbryantia sp.]|uniref:efflux RND transporter permease subunit n=1 Tax=Marvinbryantia sp. TaxID=2496532 RepID=UPI00266FC1C2|nr:efflux RND transporter permease subunit [uncultured Marvinbryantia sp.]